MLNNPINFDSQLILNDTKIVYTNLMEICQGCPAIGDLTIDGVRASEKFRFGGSAIGLEAYLYAPVFVRRLRTTGFKLAKININSRKMELIGSVKSLIFLDKIENGYIYFYEDLEKTKKSKVRVHED